MTATPHEHDRNWVALFYTALSLAALAAALEVACIVFVIKGRRRRSPAECPRCAYDRTGLPTPATPCPECGRPAALPSTISPPLKSQI